VQAVSPPLYRYSVKSDKLEGLFPAGSASLTSQSASVSPDGVVLAAYEGVYWLARGTEQWVAVPLPAPPHGFVKLVPLSARIESPPQPYLGSQSTDELLVEMREVTRTKRLRRATLALN